MIIKRSKLLDCIKIVFNISLCHLSNAELKEWLKLKKNEKSDTNDKYKMITKYRCEKSANGFDLSILKFAIHYQ